MDENNRSAKIVANGAATVVPLSDWDMQGYKFYGNEFCQNFFIEMKLQDVKGEMLAELVTTELIAATLPNYLTYLHTTYKYMNGAWEVEKTVLSNDYS